jgi:hypothetical protein
MNIMFNKLNILAILLVSFLLISCDIFKQKKSLIIDEVTFSGWIPGKNFEWVGKSCAEFNQNRYVVNGSPVYVAPSFEGYLFIYYGFPNDPKVAKFVLSHFGSAPKKPDS